MMWVTSHDPSRPRDTFFISLVVTLTAINGDNSWAVKPIFPSSVDHVNAMGASTPSMRAV